MHTYFYHSYIFVDKLFFKLSSFNMSYYSCLIYYLIKLHVSLLFDDEQNIHLGTHSYMFH